MLVNHDDKGLHTQPCKTLVPSQSMDHRQRGDHRDAICRSAHLHEPEHSGNRVSASECVNEYMYEKDGTIGELMEQNQEMTEEGSQ